MMAAIYSLAITLWTIVRITVNNPLLLTLAMSSLLMSFLKRTARS